MGTKRQKPFRGPLTEGRKASKQQKLLVAAGQCRECGSPLGRAKTICDTCANKAAAVEAERREAEKSAAQANKNVVFVLTLPKLHVGPDGEVDGC
jgi:hypothetical protein